jgi:homocysteine S-methyltransferase
VTLLTANYADEATGFVRAAQSAGVPCVVSFTVEVDGRLPDGSTLGDAVQTVDDATAAGPAYYMVNCAHPQHVRPALDRAAEWTRRVVGVRANASTRSHAELDAATELDDGDPVALAGDLLALRSLAPSLTVLGGCCGTDIRHIDALATALTRR